MTIFRVGMAVRVVSCQDPSGRHAVGKEGVIIEDLAGRPFYYRWRLRIPGCTGGFMTDDCWSFPSESLRPLEDPGFARFTQTLKAPEIEHA